MSKSTKFDVASCKSSHCCGQLSCQSNNDFCRLNPSAPSDSSSIEAVFQVVIWLISALSEPLRRLQKEALWRHKAASVAPVVPFPTATPQQTQNDPSGSPSWAGDPLSFIKKKIRKHVCELNPLCEEYQH